MTEVAAVEAAITDAHRSALAGMLAATVRVARDLDLAEERVQEMSLYARNVRLFLRVSAGGRVRWSSSAIRSILLDLLSGLPGSLSKIY